MALGSMAIPACPSGSICLFTGDNFDGKSWEWTKKDGYHDMPADFHDNVGSFVASTDGCFINWHPKEARPVNSGDYRINYGGDFGNRIDGVDAVC
ncbi:hypothetical protein DFA_07523 [Cavenderia fasciculata]|uniref:Uncharacterized protein n=1 Tax=Cavenderia fasciculata TaxID=261658 RepID=F4PWN5_CACFS|nr:uncharacterized protein DFA_07523 [Cavenderia fasciculata]EGG20399.1 hypothetical protein DFA_07523 [Cavenderia fasciculata]|eukprot:XP_004367382.1 hypothetical protein DFA_07523 [Cavenderia fasciculata]